MNFFQRQRDTRALSRRLVLLFVTALLGVVFAVTLVLSTAMASAAADQFTLPGIAWVQAHWRFVVTTAVLTLAVIGIASTYKTVSLSSGGGAVARALGGVRVVASTTDPAQKRLLNVVEEMSIASGVPMPEVYLLEQELGINAFAAGHSPADAAVAVTRGTLESLDRAELQGVIAHEFSHILNGDMRLNVRLMGWLFGLLVIAMIARTVLEHTSRSGRSNRKGGAAGLALVALAVLVIGYVGLFFGRLIQAAVSRTRESLADASAVQFTRDPTGLRNALVKIGAADTGSKIAHPETEEVAHMLFAPGMSRLFATHPSLPERIRAIDPTFGDADLAVAKDKLARRRQVAAVAQGVRPAAERLQDLIASVNVTPAGVAALVGNPATVHIDAAHTIRESLPPELVSASDQPSGARALLFALALAGLPGDREVQRRYVEAQLGSDTRSRVEHLLLTVETLSPLQRMPMLFRAFPALRRLTREERLQLIATLNGLLQREGALNLSSYALRKVAQVHLQDELTTRTRVRQLTLAAATRELQLLLSLLALEGHRDRTTAAQAYEAGARTLTLRSAPLLDVPRQWPAQLDAALNRLDLLQPAAKELLIESMVRTISHDQQLDVAEAELLRAVCACLHCPLPPFVRA